MFAYNTYNSAARANIFICAQTHIDNENETLTEETKEKCCNRECIMCYEGEQREESEIAGHREK